MPPKKRRQDNNHNKENSTFNPISIQSIIDENLQQFEGFFNNQSKQYENLIEEKLILAQKEFNKYLQTHQSQEKLAQLLDQEITRINQNNKNLQCQELLDKTTDLMNASSSDSSRTKTYLIGELQKLPFNHEKK